MRVKDVMIDSYEAVQPETPFREAADRLARGRGPSGGGLPTLLVMEKDRLAGIITVTDLLKALFPTLAQDPRLASMAWEGLLEKHFQNMQGRAVREIMTPEVITVQETALLTQAAELFFAHHIQSLPVLQRNRVTGILYLSDLGRRIFSNLTGPPR